MARTTERWFFALLIVILLLGAALRFYQLGTQSLWNDEGTTVALAQRDLPTIIRNAAADIHPPLYYFALSLWVKLAGTSEFAVRTFSALAGTALVLVIYLLGRTLLQPGTALLATLFAALAPLEIYYSQETRMYLFAALLGALSWLAFSKLVRPLAERETKPWSMKWAVAYLALSVAAVYSHYVVFALILAQNCYLLGLYIWLGKSRQWRWLGGWLGLQLLLGLAYVPWLLLSWNALTGWPAVGAGLGAGPFLSRIAQVLAYGVTIPPRMLVSLTGLILLGLAILVPVLGKRKSAWLCTAYLVVPLVALFVLSLGRPLFKDKFLVLVHPAFMLLLASASAVLAKWAAGILRNAYTSWIIPAVVVAVVLATSGISLLHLYYDPAYQRDNYRGIVSAIERSAAPDDVILINAPSQIETVGYYHHGPQEMVPLPLTRPLDTIAVEKQLQELVSQHKRLYGIFWATNESDPQRFIEGWLDQHAYKAVDQWFGALRLLVYAVPMQVSDQPEVVTAYRFAQDIILSGYTISTPSVRSGDIVQLTLYWQSEQVIHQRYKVFIHLVDAQGRIVAQRDSEPGGGAALTTTWQPGEVIIDRYGILLPADAPGGQLTVQVGLYGLDDGERLPVSVEGQADGDSVDLGSLQVTGTP